MHEQNVEAMLFASADSDDKSLSQVSRIHVMRL